MGTASWDTTVGKIRDLLAASATFQTWTGEANATDARTHTFYCDVDKAEVLDKMAIVDVAQGYRRESVGCTGSVGNFMTFPTFSIYFDAALSDGAILAASRRALRTTIGQIMDEIEDLAGTSTYIPFFAWELGSPAEPVIDDEAIDRISGLVLIQGVQS